MTTSKLILWSGADVMLVGLANIAMSLISPAAGSPRIWRYVIGDGQRALFKFDRRLTTTTYRGSQLQMMLFMLKMRRQMAPRLEREARRRGGQPVPKINLPE
jgi:hypothetical protein